ncbi:hypothetical protein [uncultured Microbacterium sp.]|uniref:hypothetical protein n=1 Tax=uncultured Microbacterium sp. TaxID=191216 RepID=UPI0025D6D8B5|nr:hypothetical protein [uncultured Microbacterium sp.]
MTLPFGREALERLDPKSGAYQALAVVIANAENKPAPEMPSGRRTRADIEAFRGQAMDVIAIRCSGHAVNGKLKRPRIGYAIRFDAESAWHFGGTLSAAMDVDTKAARSPWANSVRTESYLAKPAPDVDREVLSCSGCADRFVFTSGERIDAALSSLIEEDRHTVTIAELRARY